MSADVSSSSNSARKLKITESVDSGILNERVLVLVFESMQWDIRTLCQMASVNRRLRAVAKRLLWRHLCLYRAPQMMSTLTEGVSNSRIVGGWQTLAKLMFFCGGVESTPHFEVDRPLPGHFVPSSRFSKTSGMSFLSRKCRGDVLYVTDPCEHRTEGTEDVIGVYRGVYREFMKSRTREFLVQRQVDFVEELRCPYCATRVWSMTSARMISRKNAARRLGSNDDALEYFVCLNGHLHGACWLVHLSSSDDNDGVDSDQGVSYG